MKCLKTIEALKSYRGAINDRHMAVGFVPTMGSLHQGHLSLIKRSLNDNDITIVSIFVNPTQFNNPDDLKQYPRELEKDMQALRSLDVDAVFLPAIQAMYPMEFRYQLREVKLSLLLEGAHRQGHFDGVLTVVNKLFNLVRPACAYFGEKDYQQYCLIRDMVDALFMPIDVIACETVRDQHGLALSSRNARLSDEGVERARLFARLLQQSVSCDELRSKLNDQGFDVEYVEQIDGRRYAALNIESVRLIDNMAIEE